MKLAGIAAAALVPMLLFATNASAAPQTITYKLRASAAGQSSDFTLDQGLDANAPATVAPNGTLKVTIDPAPNKIPTEAGGLPQARTTETVELADGERFELRIAPVAKRIGDHAVRMLAYNGSVPGPVLRVQEMPVIDVFIVPSLEEPGGIGEPSTAVIAGSLANAVYAATGTRIYSLPIRPEQFRGATA